MVGLLPSKFDFRMMNGHLAGAARLQTPAGRFLDSTGWSQS
jgi:hypothetical protein